MARENMFINKKNRIALFIAAALGYGGLVDVYAQDSFYNTWFNIDNFDKDSKAQKQQALAMWSLPHARAARVALMEEQHRRVEKLATFLMRPNDKGEKMAPMAAYEQAWNTVYAAARRDAKRALQSEAVREMLENPDGVDEAAWLESMTPELVHGLIYALEEQYDGFDYRDDGRDARRAYLLTRALEKEGWSKGMDEKEFATALQQESLKQAAYLMAEGVDPSDAFKLACTQVRASSQLSSFFRTTGPIVWSGPGNVADLSELDPEYVRQMTEAAKKIVAATKAMQEKLHSTQSNSQSLTKQTSAAPVAVSAPVAPHAVSGGAGAAGGFGGSAGTSAPQRTLAATRPPLLAAPSPTGSDAPGGDVVWAGSASVLKDGVSATFDKTSTSLDITLDSVWRPYDITVNDSGVKMTKRGDALGVIGYAFNGSGSIGDYVDESGNKHATTLTKKGSGILVMAHAGNSYSGGTDVQGGTLYVADQGALGTGAVTLHDKTSLWVNYTWNNDYSSSFRNPVVSNSIRLTDGAAGTVSYGDYPYQQVLGNDSSRIWRTLYLTGGLSGDAASSLYLQGYTSRYGNYNFSVARKHLGGNVSLRGQIWYSGNILNRSEAAEGEGRFYGTLTLGNRTNTSTAGTDNLSNRETGAVKLVLSDDVLEYGTLDATREFAWVKDSSVADAAKQNELMLAGTIGGTAAANYTVTVSDAVKNAYTAAKGAYNTLGLHQTNANVILISNNTKIGELKADFLGVTQDSYRDAVNWSEGLEAKLVRVVTLENNATLTLGKDGSTADSWFSGTVGFENQLCDANGDGYDTLTKGDYEKIADTTGTTVAGISLVKTGGNAQYIHSAKLHNLEVQDGTLGFNNVQLVNNLTLVSGSKLQLGVQNDRWKEAGTINLQVGDNSGINHRFAVVTTKTDDKIKASGTPLSARVEGSLVLNEHTEIAFEVNALGQESGERQAIIPAWVQEGDSLKGQTDYLSSHSLLQVTAATQRTDADKGGILTLNNASYISISGVNFLKEDYTDKIYFLAAADEIQVNKDGTTGAASAFDTRVISLGYGYYGLISTIDGHGTTIGGQYTTYGEEHADYLGQDYLVMRVAADPTRSWTGSTLTTADHAANVWTAAKEEHYADYLAATGAKADAQWKENRAYTDGVSVKFGNLWMPTAWEKFLTDNPGATVTDFKDLLTSSQVTKVDGKLYSQAAGGAATGNGTVVTIGGITHGTEGSTYDGVRTEGHNEHYEKVVIEGTVRPGFVTINSDFNLKQEDGSYVTVSDDTNYVFTGTGCIADATPEIMKEIYGSLLGNGGDTSMLDDWKTGLSKGGTGALVMQTENTYSGGTTLHGGLTVMGNKWALGMENPALAKTDPRAKGGKVEMSYGAGLMADYITTDAVIGKLEDTIDETLISNDITITHMADYDNKGAKGDAQIFNRYDSILTLRNLSSYDDAILTLRGVSLEADDARAHKEGDSHTYYNYAQYLIANPVNAYGTIRMAGYLQDHDGSLVDMNGDAYVHGGGKVQLTLTGHPEATVTRPRWNHTTIDLSLNGSAENVLALDTRFVPNDDSTAAAENKDGATPLYVVLGTLKDDGKGGHNARVINDASSERLGALAKDRYLVTLTLNPTEDASFSGDVGFGIGQNAVGAALPSRGYISLVKEGAALQSIGNARLLDLAVKGSGLMHFTENLSVRGITTTNAGAQHIHIGSVEDAAMSHTLTVGKGGVLSFDTTLDAADPLSGVLGTETDTKYGSELSYVLLKDGATVTGSGNWYTEKGIAVAGGAEITFNTHDYSMDDTVSSDMAVYGAAGQVLKDAFDDSHIFWLKQALAGDKVTLNLINEQMSAGATEAERGTATANGYFLTHDLNAYLSSSKKVYYGLQGGSTVNIGAKTILQSYESAGVNSGIEYNIKGTDAALQFLDASSNKLSSSGVTSYVDKATISEGGRIILGGAAAATTATTQNTDGVKTDITADADVVITNKAGQTATVQNMAVKTVNQSKDGVTYETTLYAADSGRAEVEHAEMTAKQGKTLVQDTDVSDTLISLKAKCSVSLENVALDKDSKIEGAGPANGNMGADALAKGATAASNQAVTAQIPSFSTGSVTMTDADTRINVSLSNTQNVKVGNGIIQVSTADQLSKTDVGGKGLTLGLSKETLEKAGKAGVHFIAIQVSDSGRFLYEQESSLGNVTLTDHDGKVYAAGDIDIMDPTFVVKVVSSEYVAQVLGVAPAAVSNTLLYIEVPEPATALLSLFALAGMTARRRRH